MKKIWIYFHRDFMSTWIESGILADISKYYDVTILVSENLNLDYSKIQNKIIKFNDSRGIWLYEKLIELKQVEKRYASKSFTFRLNRFFYGNLVVTRKNLIKHPIIIIRNLSHMINYIKSHKLQPLFYFSIIRNAFILISSIYFKIYSIPKESTFHFDLLIIPSSGIEAKVFKMIDSCNKYQRKTLLAVENWDNLTSKSAFVSLPNYISVMGEQCKQHAISMYKLNPNDVLVNSLPRFNKFHGYRLNNTNKNSNKKNIMYLGFSVPHNEHQLVNFLIKNLQINLEPNSFNFIYRPHPARQKRFFEDTLKNDLHLQINNPPISSSNNLPEISKNYFRVLENMDLVIATPTTMALETIMLNIPIVIDGTNDGIHKTTSGNSLNNYTHLLDFKHTVNKWIANDMEELLNLTIERLTKLNDNNAIDITKIIDIKNSYSKGLIDFIREKL